MHGLTGLTYVTTVAFNLVYTIGDIYVLYIPSYLVIVLWMAVGMGTLAQAVAGAVGLAAVVSGNAAVTDPLAMLLLYLRVGQSVVHLISTSVAFVMIRATLFVGQVLIVLYWSYCLLTA